MTEITREHKEFENEKGLKVFYDDLTGNITVENDEEIVFSVYDDGNWQEIKSQIAKCIIEY